MELTLTVNYPGRNFKSKHRIIQNCIRQFFAHAAIGEKLLSISFIPIEEIFEKSGHGRLVPSFSFAETTFSSFRLLRMQCKGKLVADSIQGPRIRDDSHYKLCKEALKLARETGVDLFVTPEYAFPMELIGEILTNTDLQPPNGKLWCLACQGESCSRFEDYLGTWEQHACVVRPLRGHYHRRDFVCALIYVFMGSDNNTLCIVPQLKLHSSADPEFYCEGEALSRGTVVYTFGSGRPNQLCSIICADAFHPDMHAGLFFPNRNENWIILHPQLNKRPRHPFMIRLRDAIFSRTEGRHVVYITANWADLTEVNLSSGISMRISTPWSCIYAKHAGEWLNVLRASRNDNFSKGLGFAYWDDAKVKVWYSHKQEHMQLVAIEKPNPATAEVNGTPAGAKVLRTYVPDDSRSCWCESDLPFDGRLPNNIAELAHGPFEYPLESSTEQRDRFFGLCLGHREEGQLQFAADGGGKEVIARVAIHVDDECERFRKSDADYVGRLFYCLKQKPEHLPGQIRYVGDFRLGVSDSFPDYNLFPLKGDERDGVWVAYARNEDAAKEMAEDLLKLLGKDREHKVCVFSTKFGSHETVAYPNYRIEFTAPNRIGSIVEFTEGAEKAWKI